MKLKLNKETLRTLTEDQALNEVIGGEKPGTLGPHCSRFGCPSYLSGCPGSWLHLCATKNCAE